MDISAGRPHRHPLCVELFACLLLLVSACNRNAVVAVPTEQVQMPGDLYRSLTFAGEERKYLLHTPPGYDAAHPRALVLAFHGIGLNAEEMKRISALSAEADRSGFVVVYPEGSGATQSWNGGHCCGEAARNRVDDVGFVRQLIAEVSETMAIDPGRVYATGFSNGAILVYRLACELSDQIAAVAPVSATQVLDDQQACKPLRPIPIIHFHGTADQLNPYNGGTTAAGLQWVSVPQAMTYWAQVNGCSDTPAMTETGNVSHAVYGGCQDGGSIELYTVTDGQHAWPGGEAVSAEIGEPTAEISASALLWEFFAAHPRR